jgi:hypothetical protein
MCSHIFRQNIVNKLGRTKEIKEGRGGRKNGGREERKERRKAGRRKMKIRGGGGGSYLQRLDLFYNVKISMYSTFEE